MKRASRIRCSFTLILSAIPYIVYKPARRPPAGAPDALRAATFTGRPLMPYIGRGMFVAVACEFVNDDHRKAGYDLLAQYGFQKVQKDAFESVSCGETALNRLKRDLDRIADSYDSIRLYQYPVDGTLAITTLKEKKWRRLIVKA